MIRYEWVIETVDEYDDIIDVDHSDTFAGAMKTADGLRSKGKAVEIGLVRDHINDIDENLESRQWAYLKSGKLPRVFDGAAPIPQRFFKEVAGA